MLDKRVKISGYFFAVIGSYPILIQGFFEVSMRRRLGGGHFVHASKFVSFLIFSSLYWLQHHSHHSLCPKDITSVTSLLECGWHLPYCKLTFSHWIHDCTTQFSFCMKGIEPGCSIKIFLSMGGWFSLCRGKSCSKLKFIKLIASADHIAHIVTKPLPISTIQARGWGTSYSLPAGW